MHVKIEDISKRIFNKILVMSLGGFGDTIMATPLCILLRQRYPAANLIALTMWSSSAAVLRNLGVFNDIIAHNFITARLKDSLQLAWQLRQKHFDLSILVYPANRAHYNILSRLINARYRLGHDYHLGSSLTYCRFLLTNCVRQTHSTHNVEENMKIAKILGINSENPKMSVGTLGVDQDAWSEQFLAKKPPPYFGIHPGCSPIKNHTKRRWPAGNFALLANKLIEKTNGTCVVFLGPDETDLENSITSIAPETTIVSHTSIERVTALIRRCQLFVASDSSLAHLAAACGIPVVMILGPTNPEYIKPGGVPYKIVSLQLDCSPCFEMSRKPLQCHRDKDFACVRDISVSSVMSACVSLLEETQVESERKKISSKYHKPKLSLK